jgi:death-on-curing protein
VIFLNEEELLSIAERVVDQILVRDHGLLAAAVARPQASAFGEDAYPDLESKAGALLQSLVRNHPLIDGNKRLGLAATIAFLGVNGRRLTLSNDEAYDFVIEVATGRLADVSEIAAVPRAGSEPRPSLRGE